MRSAWMTWAPRAANISPTAVLPQAIPPVRPTRSTSSALQGEGGFAQAGAAAQARRFHRVGHQHGDGQGAHAAGHGGERARHFRHFGMNITDQGAAVPGEGLLALFIALKKALELHPVGELVHAYINHRRSWLHEFA